MPLLTGHLDPTLFNATVISAYLREIDVDLIQNTGELRYIDRAQFLLDRLLREKIVW